MTQGSDGSLRRARIEVLAPFRGRIVALEDVGDPVFAQAMVGPGIALDPVFDSNVPVTQDVLAPSAGTVTSLFPHAFVLEIDPARSVLVHLGIDSLTLGGQGFETLVALGDTVKAGQPLMTWSPSGVAAHELATVSPIVAVQADTEDVLVLAAPGTVVEQGTALVAWT